MSEIVITVKQNGPYLVPGDAKLVDHEGNTITTPQGKKTIALCRCGGSITKPFCDGTHSRIGFRGAEAAQKEFDGRAEPGAPSAVPDA